MIKLISEMESTHKVGLANQISAYVVLVVAQTNGLSRFFWRKIENQARKNEPKLLFMHLRGRNGPQFTLNCALGPLVAKNAIQERKKRDIDGQTLDLSLERKLTAPRKIANRMTGIRGATEC